MSAFPGARNVVINGGTFSAVAHPVANAGVSQDIVGILHSHSATAGLLDARERFDAPKCDKDTRTSMILEMKKFVQDGDAASSSGLYWLHGPAGVGKSALAQSLSLSLEDERDHAASFFFSRTSPGRNDGNRLIVTLAYQLAINFPALQSFISKVVRTNPGILTASNAAQMQSLIINPIRKWHKKYTWSFQRWTNWFMNSKIHPRLILVDGLDECDDPKVQTDLILCIAAAVRQLPVPLRFVIASRPESHIITTFELDPGFQGLNGVKVTKMNLGEDEDADEQITTFLVKEFARIRETHPIRKFLPPDWPSPDQIRQLVSKSSKGFIYPATVIRYIGMPHNRPDKCLERILGLSEIPTFDRPYETLDFLYRYIFESVTETNKRSIRNIFHFLVLPTTWDGVTEPPAIERHFGFPKGHVLHVLNDLLCLVTITREGYIKVLHASLPDFLNDASRSGPLYIGVEEAHTTVAGSYLLDFCDNDNLPGVGVGFGSFLDHLMQADVSNALLHRRILNVDLLSRFRKVCSPTKLAHPPSSTRSAEAEFNSNYSLSIEVRLSGLEIQGIAFMVAYLLVLVLKNGPEDYIRNQITALKAYVIQTYPPAGSVHTVHDEIIPTMTPLFRNWASRVYGEHINRVFACQVVPSQNELREAILELHFLMMSPLYPDVVKSYNLTHYYVKKGHSRTEDPDQWIKGDCNYWANIVLGRNYSSTDTPPP